MYTITKLFLAYDLLLGIFFFFAEHNITAIHLVFRYFTNPKNILIGDFLIIPFMEVQMEL
jgi:hypothetical protein